MATSKRRFVRTALLNGAFGAGWGLMIGGLLRLVWPPVELGKGAASMILGLGLTWMVGAIHRRSGPRLQSRRDGPG